MITVYVDMDTVAQHLRANPDDLMLLLRDLAGTFDDTWGYDQTGLDQYCKEVAESHEGSAIDNDVAPFLLLLAEKLKAEERGMQP